MELWQIDEPYTPLELWQLRPMVTLGLEVIREIVQSVPSYCERWRDGTPTFDDRMADVAQMRALLCLPEVA